MWFAEKGHSWKYEESSYVIMVKKDIQIVHEIDVEIMWLDLKEWYIDLNTRDVL